MKYWKRNITIVFFTLFSINHIQAFLQIGIGTVNPQGALDIKSDSAGLLIPRVSLSSVTDVNSVKNPNGSSIEVSTIIYNTGENFQPAGFYYWDGSLWHNMSGDSVGDVCHKLKNGDHQGWYLLDGRPVTALPQNARENAIALGFTTNLPDATNRILKAPGTNETLGSQVGSSSILIAQNNLPDFNMSATTATAGAHTPTGTTSTNGSHQHNYQDSGSGERGILLGGVIGISLGILDTGPFARSQTNSKTTGSAGNHSHSLNIDPVPDHSHGLTVNSGGQNQPLSNVPASLVTNVFVFLGR